MSNFDLLSIKQVQRDNQIEVFKKFGTKSEITDFAILLGGKAKKEITKENKREYTGRWWLKNIYQNKYLMLISFGGTLYLERPDERICCGRPITKYSEIEYLSKNKIRNNNEVLEVEYGEYPQTIVPEKFSEKLEKAYNEGMLKTTGNKYTTDSAIWDEFHKDFYPRTHIEYEYNNKKYIRFVADLNSNRNELSDERTIKEDNSYWISVEPIKWIIDEKEDIAISKKLLFSGIQYSYGSEYYGDYENCNIKKFMNNYFEKEIKPKKIKTNIKKNNEYGFNYDEVSEEEIIKGAIESNISVFLHGRSSEGKSARVKQIDPNCVIIYLRNATPESLNGKSVYNSETGEMIDIKPTWLKKLEIVCEKEPDKNHIVFFDEITNALPSIQGIAFNIVLDKEVNGMWKLPDNARIVAAGNEMNDSLAANQLAEPLFNRFAHVYIETTVDKWLEWASKNNIHPAIYAYIAYRKDEALRSKYNGEKPNADPRKWEMASNILYKTRRPEMLRALLGTDITNEFIWFTKQKVITLEDVLNDNYSEEDLNLNTGEKYMTVVGLLNAKEEDYPKVLEFLKKLGNEFISIFNTLWTKDNEERLEIIAETKQDIKKKIKIKQN